MGKKVGMTQIFDNEGNIIPVTALEAGPCTVLGLKENPTKVVLGYQSVKKNRLNKPVAGFFKKIAVAPLKRICEFASTDNKNYKIGQEIKADLLKPGDFVDVTGVSIGKGFQGGMVRWNWSGGPAAHGSMHHRRIGSNSPSSDPSRTYKGKHMPGHMGMDTVTVQGLRVMRVEVEQNLILVKGAVPGAKNGILVINKSRKKAYRSFDEKKEVVAIKRNPMKQSKAAVGKTTKK